jgi:hypothetical protein
MAIPLIGAAAMAAGRVVAKKLATRVVGGITGTGAKSVGSVYREMGTGSITKIPSITKNQQKVVNELRTGKTNDAKSGVAAKDAAKGVEEINKLKIYSITRPPLKTVKVNSNPMRGK